MRYTFKAIALVVLVGCTSPAATPSRTVTPATASTIGTWALHYQDEVTTLTHYIASENAPTEVALMLDYCQRRLIKVNAAQVGPAYNDPNAPPSYRHWIDASVRGYGACAQGDFDTAIAEINEGKTALDALTALLVEATPT